ncbi:MAG: polyribonucleotide nucleotidyltransferase, partial [Acidimicrobiales bacterium]
VEDVLTLGQPIEVRVDDIDQQGKVSLSLASEPPGEAGSHERRPRRENGHDEAASSGTGNGSSVASFEDAFEAELVADLGDLGPGSAGGGPGRGDQDRRRSRGPRRR